MSDPFPNPQKMPSAFRKRNSFLTKPFLTFQLQKAKLGPRACFQIIILKKCFIQRLWQNWFCSTLIDYHGVRMHLQNTGSE